MTDRPRTEDLIRALAASPPPPALTGAGIAWPMLGGLAVTVGAALAVIGLRPDLGAALMLPQVAAKTALPLVLAVLALVLALRSARPGRRLRAGWLAAPAAAALALFLQGLAQTPSGALLPAIMGHSAAACLVAITALSAPAIALGLWAARRGAPLRPRLTGGLIGMAASAGAAAGYALHCTEDSPLFFTTWYGLAIVIGTAIGALAGRRVLRW